MGTMRSGRRWFLHFVGRSIEQRRGRVAVAVFAVTVAAAIVVCSLGISAGIREKLGRELRAYGANVIVGARDGAIPPSALDRVRAAPGVEDATGQYYRSVTVEDAPVELIGLDLGRALAQGWRIEGRWPEAAGEVILGADLARATGRGPGDMVRLGGLGRDGEVLARVAGVVERGGPEDGAVLMDTAGAWRTAGAGEVYGSLLLRVRTDVLDRTVEALRAENPAFEVRTLRQVAYAEESFLGKMQLLMGLVTVVVLIATSISVASTMTATVLERIKEIGLMKALGARRSEIGRFYLAEGLAIGLAGGLAGFFLGWGAAEAVALGAFGSLVRVPLYVLPVSVLLGVAIATGATFVPLQEALRGRPAVMLREE
jgi:putative ABC transport system permease protein